MPAGGSLARNQAHGAPANLIDLYAAADIPETEIFGTVDDTQFPMLKLSASAAHLNGTALVASESFTWLRDHFQTTLADLKHATDFLFVSGINHLFFHGVPYSPREAAWPGWQFYAAVNFGPDGGLWHDLPAYTAYVTRCQSILQSGRPDNDVLLYLPIYDFWQKTEPLHMTFTVHNQNDWLTPSSFYHAAMMLRRQGYTFDAVSDRFLGAASCRDGQVFMHETPYRAVVVPRCRLIPLPTLQALLRLADAGATVLFEDQLPVDVPGLARLDDRRAALKTLLAKARPACGTATENSQSAGAFGRGTLRVGDLAALLAQTPIAREAAATAGLAFERRRRSDGFDYFLVNRTETAFDGWLPLGRPAQSAVLMDPLYDNRTGWAALQTDAGKSAVYLQLPPGQSVILRTFSNQPAGTPAWAYTRPAGETRSVDGVWTVAFIDGGPVLPEGFQTSRLASWTHRDDPEAARFFGTARYTITLDMGAETADDWRLELGRVCESARLTLNGVDLGTLWAEPFQRHLGRHLTVGKNTLQIDVTNRAANRIRDLDRRQVNWKYFHDANVVNIDYKPFDAADWPLAESGLIGPVRLTPLKTMHPEAPQPAPTAKD